jgi:hypothetical protein
MCCDVDAVRALVRTAGKALRLPPDAQVVHGDVTRPDTLTGAADGVEGHPPGGLAPTRPSSAVWGKSEWSGFHCFIYETHPQGAAPSREPLQMA